MKKREKEDEEGLLNRRSIHASSSSSVYIDDRPDSPSYNIDDSDFSPWPHVFNLANCIIGVSMLAMPYVFQQCGILLAAIMIAICAVLTKLTCHFLAHTAFQTKLVQGIRAITSEICYDIVENLHHMFILKKNQLNFLNLRKKIMINTNVYRTMTYESLAMSSLGSNGRRFVELCLLVFLVSSIVAFIVVIGDIGPHIVAEYLELEAPTQRLRILVMVLVITFIVLPLSVIDDLKKFSVISSLACLFYAVFVLRMIMESLPTIYDGEWSIHVVWWRPQGFLTCLPIVCMAMCCQTQLFPVISCIRNVTIDKCDLVISQAINICAGMYAAVGVFGYVAFYSHELHGDVLVQFAPTIVTQSLKLAFLLSIAVSIPLMLFPARTALFCLLLREKDNVAPTVDLEKFTFHILTVLLLIFNTILAILTPNVEFILGLTGAFIGSLVSTIIPSIMYLAHNGRTTETANRARKEKDSSMAAKICLVIGLFILIASTCAILNAEKKTSVVEKPKAKEDIGEEEKPMLKSLESLEERVLDANLNISQKLDDISEMAAKGNETEAVRMLVEMKEQQLQQQLLIEKQEKIVAQLNKVEKAKEPPVTEETKLDPSSTVITVLQNSTNS